MTLPAPAFPAGPLAENPSPTAAERAALIDDLARTPALLRAATDGLSAGLLDTPYRNWSARQIVHHLADSHAHSFLRCKLALTEDGPTIKPYNEGATADLADSRSSATLTRRRAGSTAYASARGPWRRCR